MIGFLVSAIVVIAIVVGFWLGNRALEGCIVSTVAVCFALFLIFGLVFNVATKSEAKGPCHQYETKLMYNAATKTMMPSRVCVLRGEWVGDDK